MKLQLKKEVKKVIPEREIMVSIKKGILTDEEFELIDKEYTAVVMNFLKEKSDFSCASRYLASKLDFPEGIVRYVLRNNSGKLKIRVINSEEFYKYSISKDQKDE